MAIPIPSPLVEFILLGPMDDRRQLQDSPILGDVWVEFGKRPAGRIDLLISPYKGQQANAVAVAIDESPGLDDGADVAYLQGLVAARLTFKDVLKYVLPRTKWWIDKRMEHLKLASSKKKVSIVEEGKPHLIDLLDEAGF